MKNKILCSLLIVGAIVLGAPSVFAEDISVESYGLLPKFRSLTISPDGKYYAFIKREGEIDYVVVSDASTGKYVAGLNASKVKARSVEFVTNGDLILRASKTKIHFNYRGRWESSAAFAFNLKTGKLRQLLIKSDNIHPAQTGLGRIVGLNAEQRVVYMPAFSRGSSPTYNLYRVSLDTGAVKLHAKGRQATIDWFVEDDGRVLARQDYVKDSQDYRVYSRLSGQWELIFSEKVAIPRISLEGLSEDKQSLFFIAQSSNREAVYSMSLRDGAVEGPVFEREDRDIDDVIVDINRTLVAIKYDGFKPEYTFVNDRLDGLMRRMSLTFPMSSIDYGNSTVALEKVVMRVSGAEAANRYVLYDTTKNELDLLLSEYPEVPVVGTLKAVKFTARDGRKIPSVLTFPPGRDDERMLPLIVLPHGGPEAYDSIQFDWWAQFLAAKGYLVVQPNYRGSSGFGFEHRDAGHGEWGKGMQNDVSDVVKVLTDLSYVDSSRVCIIGASYGGYSALAGGAFTPELYRCIVSVNGVSDLPLMLNQKTRKLGANHWVISYWNQVIGTSKSKRDKLGDISPVNFAERYKAPVLLIHGEDDTVIPIKQSKRMLKALKEAGKEVDFVTLKDEDHWLSTSRARLQMLKTIDQFLLANNPPD